MTALQSAFPAGAPSTYNIAQASRDKGVIGIVVRSGMATLAAVGGLASSNAALSYSFHYETALTNPKISLPEQEAEWFDEESSTMFSFLGFLDHQMASHSELTVPADEEQLSRIKALIAGVRI